MALNLSFLTSLIQFLSRRQESLWTLAFVLSISFFLAKGINLFVAYKYLPPEFSHIVSSRSSSGQENLIETSDTRAIMKRNIFDSKAAERIVNLSLKPATGAVTPSTLPLELSGTIVFQESRFSVALIKDRNTNKFAYYGVGDRVQSAIVRQIDRFRVVIENDGRLESLELKAAESKLAMTPPRLSTPTFTQPSGGSASDVSFEEIGPNKFAIPQSFIDETLSNFNLILTQARMVPNLTPDNKTDGFKVFAIKPGSIFEKLGMKDQDIIKRVNGQDLDSFDKATGLFGALRNEKTISIDIMRNGSRINYSYEIR